MIRVITIFLQYYVKTSKLVIVISRVGVDDNVLDNLVRLPWQHLLLWSLLMTSYMYQ